MDKQSVVILFPDTNHQNAYLQQMKTFLETDTSIKLHSGLSLADMAAQVEEAKYALAIFNVKNKTDLVEVLNFLGTQADKIKKNRLRVIGSSGLNHPDVVKILMKKGCADILPSNLSQKALRHKISQSFKILENYQQKLASQTESAKIATETKTDQAAQSAKKSSYRLLPALTLASDFWLVQNEREIRQVQGRWIIDLLGPGPSAGSWEETAKDSKTWMWSPRVASLKGAEKGVGDPFIVDNGTWKFCGRKPEFIWQESRWRFLGDQPELTFVSKDLTVLAVRFKTNWDQSLDVTENSSFAKEKIPLIMQTIDTERRFRTEEAKKGTKDLRLAPEGAGAGLELRDSQNSPRLDMWLESEQGRVAIHPVEYSDREVLVETKKGSASEGKRYKLTVECGSGSENSKETFSVIVKDIQNGDDSMMMNIKILDDVVFPTKSMDEALLKRQDEILGFMKSARGW
jgi:hypothetical protein